MDSKGALLAKRHLEHHTVDAGSTLREFILGCQDGVVNVAGIALGVAIGTGNPSIVILAGLAATFAESISMAAVAYTSSKAASDFYDEQYAQEVREVNETPDIERDEIRELYQKKGFSGKLLDQVVETITADQKVWVQTMMEEELKLSREAHNPVTQGIIVGVAAIVGSFVPLIPFFLIPSISIQQAMIASVVLVALGLFALGAYKGHMTKQSILKSGLEIAVIGLIAAGAGFLVGAYLGVPT
ncbi:MAG: VIT1/CCC1 transporter family protein [Candidatus Diapherotrites archaeon]|nr:VIT1/CCC1 transporter family protein [Candidatus Diapherotrites archaeon]